MTYWRKHLILEQIHLSKKTKDKLQAAIFRDTKPPTRMVDMGMRVEGGWAACHDAYTKADAYGLFDSMPDRSAATHQKRGHDDDTSLDDKTPDSKKYRPDRPQPDSADANTHKEKCDNCGNRPALQRTEPCVIGGGCSFWNHPDVNMTPGTFAASEKGKAYARVGRHWLVWKSKLHNGNLVDFTKTRPDQTYQTRPDQT